MLINGEKFACEACIRGHRVSSCHHNDRMLLHVNKKGRPVSQCHHCRGLRKARSQHVKCECQEKSHTKENCPHENSDLKKEPHTCCCAHGSRCTCSLKKEHLDSVPEDIPQHIQPKEPQKPRLINMNSHDSKPTVFQNGHHKPVHKFNDAHNHCGAPYKIPSRSHTVHGHREAAQRSTDSLPLPTTSKPFHESPLHNSISTVAEPMRMVKSEHNSPLLKPSVAPTSEPSNDLLIPSFDPNAYSYSPFGSNSPSLQQGGQQELSLPERFPESWFMTFDEAHEYEPPVQAAGVLDGPSVDWSTFNFNTANTLFDPSANVITNGASYATSQPMSYAALDPFGHLTRPDLNNSSGDLSEAGDLPQLDRPGTIRTTSHDASNDLSNDLSSNGGDDASERFRLSSASSFYGTPQANMLATDTLQSLDIDDYLRQAEAETRKMQLQNQQQQQLGMQQQRQRSQQLSPQSTPNNSQGFSTPNTNMVGEHPYTIHEAQQYAHLNDNLNAQLQQQQRQQQRQPQLPQHQHQEHEQKQNLAMPRTSLVEDPSWSAAPDPAMMSLDDPQEDEDWVR